MSLDEKQKSAIRDEEYYRDEVREEMATRKGSAGTLGRLSAFAESKFGYWFISTVLAGAVVSAFTWAHAWWDRERTEQRERAERARSDAETMIKLIPLLTSGEQAKANTAAIVLEAVATAQGADSFIKSSYDRIANASLAAGASENSSAADKVQANAVSRTLDGVRLREIQSNSPNATPIIAPVDVPFDNASLPARVYIQIAAGTSHTKADAAGNALRGAGIVVPPVEQVSPRNIPQVDDLRFCKSKVAQIAADAVTKSLAGALHPAPRINLLPEASCKAVRFNHFEVWLTT